MRGNFLLLVASMTIAAGIYAATAFNAADTGTRSVTAEVVGDSAAYLAVEKNLAGNHKGFVSQGADGKIVIAFNALNADATGDGINPGSKYYFDDLLNITNTGTQSVNVQVQATSTSGTVTVCTGTATGSMNNTCYAATHPTTAVSVAKGAKLYLGIAVDGASLNSGSQVSGTIKIVASR